MEMHFVLHHFLSVSWNIGLVVMLRTRIQMQWSATAFLKCGAVREKIIMQFPDNKISADKHAHKHFPLEKKTQSMIFQCSFSLEYLLYVNEPNIGSQVH